MKKLIIATAILASVTATMIMVASTPATWMVDPEGRFPSWAYLPPDTHPRREFYSSISLLVLCSEMTGIATVLQTGHTNTYYRLGVLDPEEYEDDDLKTNIFALLQVEDAFYGCTNQQIIMVDYSVFHAPPLYIRADCVHGALKRISRWECRRLEP